MSFNYTSLATGFESISLKCLYCNFEETRPFPPADTAPSTGSEEPSEIADTDAQTDADLETVRAPDNPFLSEDELF